MQHCRVGETVRVTEDIKELHDLQTEDSNWNDDMILVSMCLSTSPWPSKPIHYCVPCVLRCSIEGTIGIVHMLCCMIHGIWTPIRTS